VADYAICAARFNEHVVGALVEGARSRFDKEGKTYDIHWVPGAFELPLAARTLAGTDRYRAVVCLGAVIRGETAHFDFVAGAAARGIMDAGLATGVPVVFGVLTTDTLEQALQRAGGTHGNKGWDAASAAMDMTAFLEVAR
jgi:6,7-dimethyl-8-ribityllumazine synthase